MAEEIRALIEKIQKEGVVAGQEKARMIEDQARAEAGKIVASAQAQAKDIVERAQRESSKLVESGNAAVRQAARDTLITLKKKILDIFGKITQVSVRDSLAPEQLAAILSELIKQAVSASEVVVTVPEEDGKKLKETLLARLKEEIKKGVRIESSAGISAGFTISFDAGKSYFDFSDRALADYLLQYLNPKIAETLH